MRNRIKMIGAGIIAVIMITAVSINTGLAAGYTPGSASDPLVTKSYVDDKVSQVVSMLGTQGTISGQLAQPTMPPDGLNEDAAEIVKIVLAQLDYLNGVGSTGGNSKFTPVFAFAGQFVIADEGAELILRSGQATVYSPGENGLVDMTVGNEIYNGEAVGSNHLVIVSRSDGRGMRATTDAWFLVRGGYSIYN